METGRSRELATVCSVKRGAVWREVGDPVRSSLGSEFSVDQTLASVPFLSGFNLRNVLRLQRPLCPPVNRAGAEPMPHRVKH